MKIRIRSKKLVFGILAVAIAFTMVASAAVLTLYGSVETTANVKQSIVIREPGDTWVNYDTPITHTIDDFVSCETECYKNWIWNRACSDGVVDFEIDYMNAPAWDNAESDWDFAGFDINQFLFGETQTIRLTQKEVVWGNSDWDEIDGMEAWLTFETCGKEFDYTIEYEGLVPETDYTLIYYANNVDDYWQDEGIAFEFHTFTPDASGNGTYSNWRDPDSSIPFKDDKMAIDGIDEFEDYDHNYGAKFWLVPTEAIINDDELDWTLGEQWFEENVLWETDLGFYMDCDITEPEPLENVWNCFNLIDGGQATLKAENEYCWITCNHVDINIMPGEYKYSQLLVPVTE